MTGFLTYPGPTIGRRSSQGLIKVSAITLKGLLLVSLLASSRAAQAQQQPLHAPDKTVPQTDQLDVAIPDLRAADEATVKRAWSELQRKMQDAEVLTPEVVIPLYGKFLDQGGARYASVGVDVSARVARLYLADLRQFDKAIEAYDWALATYPRSPDVGRLQIERLAIVKAQEQQENQKATPPIPPIKIEEFGNGIGTSSGQLTGPSGTAVSPGIAFSPEMPTVVAVSPKLHDLTVPTRPGNYLSWVPNADRCVTALARQTGGRLWIATEDAGVWYCDETAPTATRWKQFRAKDGLGDDSAYALAVDQQDRVWVGTLNHGVSVWNGQTWKNYGVLDGPLGERIFDIAVCPTDGDVWMATNAGLTRYSSRNDSWSYITRANGLPSDQVQALSFAPNGDLLVGTQCDGVAVALSADGYRNWRVIKGAEQMPTTATGVGLPSNLVNDVLVGNDGTFYVGTTTGLAWSRDKGQSWNYVRGEDYADKVRGLTGGAPLGWKEGPGAVLAEDYVSCLAQDKTGHLWVGHWRAGNEVLDIANGPSGGIKQVIGQEASGMVRAILPLPNASAVVARYDEGLGNSLLASINTRVASSNASGNSGSAEGTSTPVSPPLTLKISLPVLPSPAAPPSVEELQAITQRLESMKEPLPALAVSYSGDDWTTGGDWLGRYGSRYAMLCAMQSPLDHTIVNDITYNVRGRMGGNSTADDSLRRWVHRVRWDDPRVLYNPYLGHRREAEWDDHGEVYPSEHDGPDLWIRVSVPAGVHRVSLYFFNKDGHDGDNRQRDFLVEVRKGANNLKEADALPVLAQARVQDFSGGVYKTFVVSGEGDYDFKIRKGGSYDTILQAVFADKLSGPPTGRDDVRDVFLGSTRFEAPTPKEAQQLEQKAAQDPEKPLEQQRLTAALGLWKAVEAASGQSESASLQGSARVLAYRAAQTTLAGKPDGEALLRSWRFSLALWPAQDRQEFADAMKKGWESFTGNNPSWTQEKH